MVTRQPIQSRSIALSPIAFLFIAACGGAAATTGDDAGVDEPDLLRWA